MVIAAEPSSAEPTTYRIDGDATRVEYVAHAFGVIHQRGRFADMRGTIVLDREMARGDVDFDIDTRSVDSGWNVRDAFLQSEQMLDSEHHPLIHFHSARVVFRNGQPANIEGALTLRGVTQHVTLIVTRLVCGDSGIDEPLADCHAQAAATIRRSAFGMDSFAPFLGDDVDLRFVVVARRVAGPVTSR
jgi:polyisoprenoid-binding protein YceI